MEQVTRSLILLLCIAFVGNADATSTYDGTGNHWSIADGSESGGPGVGNIPLFNIYNSGTNCAGSDDGRCAETQWGFDFTRWGETFDGGRQNTNGCVNLINAGGGAPSAQCNDYTPQPLPYRNYTLYPFWTDLIRGTGVLPSGVRETSKMAYQNFGDYVVYGWYFMREYNRDSSNSFELIIRNDNTFGMLYGELDVQNHDVLIGEQGKGSDGEHKTFAYYDDNTGGHTTFDSYDNANGNIEGATSNSSGPGWTTGKVIYSATQDNSCEVDPLSSTDCAGYDDAYAAQQLFLECANNTLYSSECLDYAEAYTDSECDRDPLFSSTCPGYYAEVQRIENEEQAMWDDMMSMQGGSDGTSDEDRQNQQGYTDGNDHGGYDPRDDDSLEYDSLNGEQQMLVDSGMSIQDAVLITMGQDDLIRLGLDPSMQWNGTDQMGTHIEEEYDDIATLMLTGELDETWAEVEHDQNIEHFGEGYEDFTMEEWYDVDVREFGQEQVDDWYGEEVQFSEEGEMVWETYDYALDPQVADDLLYNSHLDNEDLEYLIAMPNDSRDCPTCGMEEFFEEMDIPEELQDLEDYEREALEEFEDEIFEEFIEEVGEERIEDLIDDEAFEEIISEDELEDLMMPSMEEEFFEEETRQEAPAEERQEQIREQQEEIQERAEPSRDTRSRREKAGGSHLASAASISISAAVAKADFGGDSTTAGIVQNILQDSGSSSQSSSNSGAQQSFQSDGSTSSNSGQSLQANSSGDTTFQQQVEQSTGQSSIEVTDSGFQGPSVSAFETADQQTQSGSTDFISSFDDGQGLSGSDQNFGSGLNDAIASGTGISDFLSQQTPDYGKFDLAPPSAQEQKVGSAVESLAERLGSEAVATNLAEQLDAVQSGEDGQYGDQTVTVAYMGYTAGFGQYTGMAQMTDAPGYGVQSQMPDTKIDDNRYGFYMMAGNTQSKLQEMINSQYRKEN
jgi:hypothetical protein